MKCVMKLVIHSRTSILNIVNGWIDSSHTKLIPEWRVLFAVVTMVQRFRVTRSMNYSILTASLWRLPMTGKITLHLWMPLQNDKRECFCVSFCHSVVQGFLTHCWVRITLWGLVTQICIRTFNQHCLNQHCGPSGSELLLEPMMT